MCQTCGCTNPDHVHLVLQVRGMSCDHCSSQINQALNALPGVTAKADHQSGEVSLVLTEQGDLTKVKQIIEDLGFEL